MFQVISFCVIVYMAACTYSSLFDFKLLSWYRLLPNQQTDSYSIMFCAAYAIFRLNPSPDSFHFCSSLFTTLHSFSYLLISVYLFTSAHLFSDLTFSFSFLFFWSHVGI